ncbi:MAG: hypothetical protein ACRC6U_09025, partial [Fusobacteriaceae bacterium]
HGELGWKTKLDKIRKKNENKYYIEGSPEQKLYNGEYEKFLYQLNPKIIFSWKKLKKIDLFNRIKILWILKIVIMKRIIQKLIQLKIKKI